MTSTTNKTAVAAKLGIARSSLYYRPKKPVEDEQIKACILVVWGEHPAYGHKRLATALHLNKKRILRVMHRFNIRPVILRGKPRKRADIGKTDTGIPNLAKTICPLHANVLWAGDFTYLAWDNGFVYVATVMDIHTREIVGHHIGLRHTADLVSQALFQAVCADRQPQIFHSDQGSEYASATYELLLKNLNIQASQSKKASPWENGYQESFYGNFKLELGNPKRFRDLGQLSEAIHRQIHYYNQRRIHSALDMPPTQFRILQENKTTAQLAAITN